MVRDGNLITGGGVTAGIDFALTLVAEIAGDEVARSIQLAMEYDRQPPFDSGTPEKAPALVLELVRGRAALQFPERQAAMRAARGGSGVSMQHCHASPALHGSLREKSTPRYPKRQLYCPNRPPADAAAPAPQACRSFFDIHAACVWQGAAARAVMGLTIYLTI